MCGLTGFLGPPMQEDELRRRIRSMSDAIVHRGPDDSGEWIDPAAGVALGFRRLLIIDLTAAGHQPMTSASGRFVIVFNGEVYNFERIRAELLAAGLAPSFRGHSDTEVMLAAIEAWGLEAAVSRFIGMFAISLWDRQERTLHLVRDRMGVKPLYYGMAGGTFVFGSELKALRRHPDFLPAIDRDALALFLKFGYVPTPFSIYRGIHKQTPGTIVSVREGFRIEKRTYWSVKAVAESGTERRFEGDERDATDALEALLRDAVGLRMISDVPLGVFLSGGIDSSLVTAMMQMQSTRPVKTFSIGFHESGYDETPHAAAVARHLGTDHTELFVTAADALAVIPRLPMMFDEPFADSSQIPTHLVSAMARRHVTVSLSGDGGDELFSGYTRYFLTQKLLQKAAFVPRPLRRLAGASMRLVPRRAWDFAFQNASKLLGRRSADLRAGERIHKIGQALSDRDPDRLYFDLVGQSTGLVPDADETGAPVLDRSGWARLDDPIERMMFFDQISYLPDDILVKVDRASMSVSLEAREPLLDHRLVEFAWRLPLAMKSRPGKGKLVLREVLYRHVPRALIERPKMGFGIPLDAWLRGPLREWGEDLLSPAAFAAHGLIRTAPVRTMWEEHVTGRGDWQHYLWSVLMFQAWFREWC